METRNYILLNVDGTIETPVFDVNLPCPSCAATISLRSTRVWPSGHVRDAKCGACEWTDEMLRLLDWMPNRVLAVSHLHSENHVGEGPLGDDHSPYSNQPVHRVLRAGEQPFN